MVKSKNSTKNSDLKSTEELEMILDNLPGLIFYKDTKNNYIKVNKYIADAHEMTKRELEGKSLFDLYPKDQAQAYWDDDLAVIKSEKPKLNFIEPWDTAEGRKWVNSSKIPLFDENNKCIGIIGFSTDVTAQVKTEQKSKQNQNQLNSIFSNLKDNVFVISEDYKILFKNENAHDIFGEDLNGRNCFEVIKGREQVCDNCSLQILSKNNLCQVRSEQQLLSPMSNKIIFFDTITSSIENYNGEKAYLEVLRDITERKEKEEAYFKLASIVENSDDAIIGKTLDGTIISWNKSAERIYGYMSQEIIGKSISILYPFGHHNELLGILEKIKVGDHIDHFETIRVRKDGEEINISLTISPIKDIAGNIIGASTIARDITSLKLIEEKLRESENELIKHRDHLEELVNERNIELKESEEWLSTTLRSIGDAVIATDSKGNIRFLNPVAESLTGWKQSDAITKPVQEIFNIINENSREEVENPVVRVIREGVIVGLANHTVLISKDGREIPIDDSGAPIKDKEGKITGVVLIFRDITSRKKMMEELHLKSISFKSSLSAQSIADINGIINLVNPAFLELWGYKSNEEAIGGSVSSFFVNPDDAVPVLKALSETGEWEGEFLAKKYDGSTFFSRGFATAIYNEQGEHIGFQSANLDITKRRENEKALNIKNRLSDVFLTIPDEDMFFEVLKIILEVMESEFGTFGYIDENGDLVIPSMTKHIWEDCQVSNKTFVFPRDRWGDSIWPRSIKMKKTLFSNEKSTITPKGHVAISRNISTPLIYQGEVIGLIQVANKKTDYTDMDILLMDTISNQLAPILNARLQRDAEEKKRKIVEEKLKIYLESLEETVEERTKQIQNIQDELVRNERLAVLGQIAGGVGHELRNPLGAIKNATYFLNMVIEEPEPEVKETLEILEREVNSSEKIIDSLLSYARPKSLVVRKIEINEIIREVLTRSLIPKNVEIIDKLSNSLLHILGDPDQLKRVFGNIISNAIQAMSKGGQLIIKSEVQNQDHLVISINDSGVGISEENLKNLFKPLFTTKAKGIGLGLAISETIVKNHGGTIEVQSELGRGSTFLIKLPINRMETI